MATSVTAPTCEGFVRKSHGSRPFSSRHVTRYLVADGFRGEGEGGDGDGPWWGFGMSGDAEDESDA